jgi:hypothetical protein
MGSIRRFVVPLKIHGVRLGTFISPRRLGFLDNFCLFRFLDARLVLSFVRECQLRRKRV